jgi:N-acetylmuramoyl-L-alanine amidase
MLALSSVAAYCAQLTHVNLSSQVPSKTSLYCAVNGPFTHRIFVLPQPNRIVIDFNGTQLSTDLRQLNLSNGLIKGVRSSTANAKSLRLVLDVNQRVKVSSTAWVEKGQVRGVRIDIVQQRNYMPLTTLSTPQSALEKQYPIKNATQTTTATHKIPIKVAHAPQKSLRDVIVVLDAGHGGKDPGAKGPKNSKEKSVVLAITLKLKQLIDRQPGMRAVLTRSGDYYVGLRERLDIARKYNGDIFVSIHADAFNNPHSNGASVFALSQRGATSEAARWIAEKENYSELGGVNLGDLDDTNGVVRSVLIDLSQTATINSGLQMGNGVLGQLANFTHLHNHKVEQARFMVLKSPDIPSILVETGFISNPIEERNLTSTAYQTRLSQAIFQGIKGYFWTNPPQGSRIEAMSSTRLHIVKPGETLPAIATRYQVTVNAMRNANHLNSWSSLKAGQKLVVPAA